MDAGKKIYIGVGKGEQLQAMKKEFGPKLKQFLLAMGGVESLKEAEEVIQLVSD